MEILFSTSFKQDPCLFVFDSLTRSTLKKFVLEPISKSGFNKKSSLFVSFSLFSKTKTIQNMPGGCFLKVGFPKQANETDTWGL